MRLQLRSSLVKPAKKVIGKQRLTVLVNVSFPAPVLHESPRRLVCFMAELQSGYAPDCKSVNAGSIPTSASNSKSLVDH